MLKLLRPVILVLALTLAVPQVVQARAVPADGFADLADKLLPAVVNISTTQTVTQRDDMQDFDLQFPEGSPFEQFFKDFMEQHRRAAPNGKAKKQKATSLGSGFIIDPAGFIVTNYHVIQDAEEITVILHDDTNMTAKVVGRDKKMDLAVLKVEPKKPLPAISFGDSDKARVGEWVIAIGNPYGLGGSVSAGIISARARDINAGPYDDFLQTDAPINRGNSGGPLLNMDGEVVGINTAIFTPTGGSIGIGFAIPSNMAKSVIEQLKTTGHTRRGWLGVRIQLVTPEIAQGLGLSEPKGALVSGLTAGGPAADAKLQSGDVIVSYDGKDVTDMHRLPRLVAETEVGKTVPMTVIRGGKEVSLKVKIGELKAEEEDAKDPEPTEKTETRGVGTKVDELGLSVSTLTDGLRRKYEIDANTNGLVVQNVLPDGQAAEVGLTQGDVISEAAQHPVKAPKDLSEAAKKAQKDGKPLLLLVDRKGEIRFVAITLHKKK